MEIIDNGSDAPGTILVDCDPAFVSDFLEADLVIAKGQGNYESLGDAPRPVWSLFKVKCSVVSGHAGLPEGASVLRRVGAAEA